MIRINSRLRKMCYLAAKYTDKSIGIELSKITHVVDPKLDFRDQFRDIGRIIMNLNKRGLTDFDVQNIAEEYQRWWTLFKEFSTNQDEGRERELLKIRMNAYSQGLLSALALPNEIDTEFPFNPSVNCSYGCELSSHLDINTALINLTEQSLAIKKFRQSLSNLIDKLLKPIPIHAPYMVRPVAIEICNISEKMYPTVIEGGEPYFRLVGVSLPSMISCFIQQRFSKSTRWPTTFCSYGTTYAVRNCMAEQRHTFVLLCFAIYKEEWMKLAQILGESLIKFFNRLFNDRVNVENVNPEELQHYESNAQRFVLVIDGRKAELARISTIGRYISERGNIRSDLGSGENIIYMGFIEINVEEAMRLLNQRIKL